MAFRLKSSKDTLLKYDSSKECWKVKGSVLVKIVWQAYKRKGLYGEDKIVFTREGRDSNLQELAATYKELWDVYHSLTGNERLHPYVKECCPSPREKARYLVDQTLFDLAEKVERNANSGWYEVSYISGIHNLNEKNLERLKLDFKDLLEEKMTGLKSSNGDSKSNVA